MSIAVLYGAAGAEIERISLGSDPVLEYDERGH